MRHHQLATLTLGIASGFFALGCNSGSSGSSNFGPGSGTSASQPTQQTQQQQTSPAPAPSAPTTPSAPSTPPPPRNPSASKGSPHWYVDNDFTKPLKTHSAEEAALAQEVLNLVNQERAAAGLAPLALDTGAEKAAKAHSEDMEGRSYFSHTTPAPESWGVEDRLKILEVTGHSKSGENIAKNSTAAAVMAAWMSSAGHRANILGDFTHIGIGVADDPVTKHVWTQVFLKK